MLRGESQRFAVLFVRLLLLVGVLQLGAVEAVIGTAHGCVVRVILLEVAVRFLANLHQAVVVGRVGARGLRGDGQIGVLQGL